MRIIAVLFIVGLGVALYAALSAKSRPAERQWLPALIIASIALGLASCAFVERTLGPAEYGVDVGDPGAP